MLRKALKSLPKTLDDTYVRILCTIKAEYCSYAFKILQWLVFSVRPLSIQEAAEILAIDEEAERGFDPEYRLEDPRDILTICSSLVTIAIAKNDHNEDYEELRLAHYSVKEYLISDQVSHGPASKYDIAVEPDKSIAQICLLYLLYFSEPSLSTYDMHAKFPLLGYAVENWTLHARAAERYTKEVALLSMELLQSEKHAFINWLSLHPHRHPPYVFVEAPLYNAAMEGLYQSTKILVDTGADVNAGGADRAALVEASSRGHTAIVQLLIDAGAEVNAGEAVHAALVEASLYGHTAIVQLLIDAGADVNVMGVYHGTALLAASLLGHYAIVELLIDAGADVNAGGADRSALLKASVYGHTAIVQLLIDAGVDVNAGEADRAALVAASSCGHTAIVQLLIDAGADVNTGGADRATLVEASRRGHDQVDEGAIYAGTDTALIKATLNGHDPIVERLLKAGARIDTIGVRGPALRMAAIKGHGRVVEQLLKAGAQVNMKTTYGSAIKVAAEEGHLGILEQLLEAGADVNADEATSLNALPATTLEAAVMNGQFQIVERLLEAGAEVNRNTETYSRTRQYQYYIQRLLEAGAEGSPAEPSSDVVYSDALHMAAKVKAYDVVLLLLKWGAKVDKRSWHDDPRSKLPRSTPERVVERLISLGQDDDDDDEEDEWEDDDEDDEYNADEKEED
jgi:ankyrin repeat protein